ncbi:MAG: DUF5686 family protein [Bacteroidota bacterium]
MRQSTLLFLFIGFLFHHLSGQQVSVKGQVKDAQTGEPIPFATVFFPGSKIGTNTDFEGHYVLTSEVPVDSIGVKYIGYATRIKALSNEPEQTLNFQLSEAGYSVEEVEIVADAENPAWEVMRLVIENKKQNDQRSLDAYQYESYSKVEIDVDNITEKFRNKKPVKKILAVMDSIQQIAGEDGKPILPVFISETLSDYYYLKDPEKKREDIRKTKLTGIALDDGSLVSQLVGSTFQQYNFYDSWIKVVDKDFVSPLATSWRAFYDYRLEDVNVMVDGYSCYRISFKPKREEDLAFVGTMWITEIGYALKQIDLKVGKSANLNFIEKIVVQQELEQVVEKGAWLPSRLRIIVDVGEVKDDWAGMLAKSYVSNRNFVVNDPKPFKFFRDPINVDELAMEHDEAFWQEARHDTLSSAEQYVYQIIDSARNLPIVKTYVEIADIAINGYKEFGPIELGPYLASYTNNSIEGNRFQLGFKTNEQFSRKFLVKAYGAYGAADKRFKYLGELQYLAFRKPWTIFGARITEDIEQIGIYNDFAENSALFRAASRFGDLNRPFINTLRQVWAETDVVKGIRPRLIMRSRYFTPLYDFRYSYDPQHQEPQSEFAVSEVIAETRISFREKFLQSGNTRHSLGTGGRPVITFRYTLGLPDFLQANVDYQRFDLSVDHSINVGILGRVSYLLTGGYVPDQVPYPLLENHLGNESVFYNRNSFNLMEFSEFISDRFVSLRVAHRFDGLIMNRVPLIRKLNWRLFTLADVLYGDLGQENIDLTLPPLGSNGSGGPAIQGLGSDPYVELGYGIENIFRFIKVTFLHRLTYLQEDTRDFGVKISAQFRL